MDLEIQEMPETRLATVHHVGPYHDIAGAFQQLGALAGAAGLFGAPGALMLGVYYDNPQSTPPEQLQSDAAVTVGDSVALPDGLAEKRLPAGRYATTMHVGSYAGLPGTWGAFMEAVAQAGHSLRVAPNLEAYLNTPGETPEDQLQTRLYIAIE